VWLRDLEKTIPPTSNHKYIGTDVTPMFFPEKGSSSISLSIQDIKEPWPEDWKNSFDLVHQRAALPAVGNKGSLQVIRNLIHLVKPGGWIQLVEPDHSVVEGRADRAFFHLLGEIFATVGSDTDIAPRIEGWFYEAGLQNVGCKIFDVPLGAKNPKQSMQVNSARFYVLGGNGIVQVARS
jgi:gliotoxin biosynthesis N-methyltransferase